jgi:hypothetical protein
MNWNLQVFLTCPLWHLNRKLYIRFLLFFLPAITWGSLLLLAYIPVIGNISAVLLLIINSFYLFLCHPFWNSTILFFNDCNFRPDNNYLGLSTLSIIYYLLYSVCLTFKSSRYAHVELISKKIFLNNINFRKWRWTEGLIFITLLLIVNHVNISIVEMGMKIMP